MSIAQGIFNQILLSVTARKNSPGQYLKYRVLMRLRRWFIQQTDPLVRWELGGKKIWINLSHQLPFLLATHPNYNVNLPRIAKKILEHYPDMTGVDVGANIGDTVALLRETATFPILCIDGEERYFQTLKKNAVLFPNVRIEKTFLGTHSQVVRMKIEARNGTATLDPGGDTLTEIHLESLDDVLERHPKFAEAKLLKIDTDGFDGQILMGSKNLLTRSQPVIFFEYDPFFLKKSGDDGLLLLEELNKMGYLHALVYENVGDFMISMSLDNKQLIEEIHHYYLARGGKKYCDICLFHRNDKELFESCRRSEVSYYPKRRYELSGDAG